MEFANRAIEDNGAGNDQDGRSQSRLNSSNYFIACHESGDLYVYNKMFSDEVPLQLSEQDRQQSLATGQRNKHFVLRNKNRNFNPILRVHVCGESINDIKFSPDGKLMALACADGYLRVFDFHSFR